MKSESPGNEHREFSRQNPLNAIDTPSGWVWDEWKSERFLRKTRRMKNDAQTKREGTKPMRTENGALPPITAPHGIPREQLRVRWLKQFSQELNSHRPDYVYQGNMWANRMSGGSFDPEGCAFGFKCRNSTNKNFNIVVQVVNPFELKASLVYWCTCPRSNSQFACEHTYAALTILQKEFSDKQSSLVESMLGPPEPTWTAALRSLDQYLQQESQAEELDAGPPKSRLAWRLVPGSYQKLTLELMEQSPSKRGGWNKGRVIGWDRIRSNQKIQFLSTDREILHSMGDLRYHYWGPTTDQIGPILEKLVGHPYVYFESTPVVVRRGQLGLMLVESGADWVLAPAVDGRSVSEFSYFSAGDGECGIACDPVKGEVIAVRAKYELWQMALEFLKEPPTIPPDAQSEFVKRLPALEAKLPVGVPASIKGDFIPAQQHLVFRLTPNDPSGATVEIQVQPAPKGTYFSPGEGPVEVAGQSDQVRVQVLRDMSNERSRAETLSRELFLQRFPSSNRFTWTMTSDDDVLDMLDTLRARPLNDPVVLWPEGKENRRMQVIGEVSPTALKVEVKDQHDWFGLSGSVTLGGQQFPLVALLAALKGGRRYLDLGKGQFAAISQEFRDRLSSVADMIHSNRGKLEFNSTAAPLLADLFQDEVTLKSSKKWKESLKRLQMATDLNPVVPSTLTADLRDYQVEGYKWLRRLAEWGVGGCLADDMGLGKTVQAIAVLIDRREIGPTLIVAPVSVGFNWMCEVERFAPTLRPILYRDTDREDFLKTLEPGDLLITSYHLLQQHGEELSAVKWGTLVLDEAQAIKNSQTKTAQAVREIQADWRLALTGTPAENHLGDLWSLFRGVAPGLFGSWERFREVFADPIEKGKDVSRKQALSRVIRPFILRRTKSEVLTELPARTEIQLTAELSKAERRLYEDARLWAVTNLTNLLGESDKDQRFQVLAALTKLRQLACHPRLVDKTWALSSAKLDLFLETIDELREGRHRALVFSQFTQHLALVREALDERKIVYQYLDGSTPVKKRQEAVEAFQRGEGELFLISLKAGGTGLNLTGADYVVHMDPWWNPAVEDQATDRAHRIGQTRPVTVYRLVAKDTIEEQILKLHADKRGLVAGILEGTDAAAKLSTTELVDLIKLGGSAT